MMKTVTAYEAYAIYACYDGMAPDTRTICRIATQELAKELCQELNKEPDKYCVVCVDGYEYCKRFKARRELTDDFNSVFQDVDTALAKILRDSED